MKAITIDKFGGPEVLKMTNVPTPIPMDREVRIKISYASVNPVDWKIREGYLATMIPHHFPLIPGWDLAGLIESCGKDVTSFKVGDRVFSYARKPEVQWGTYAEFITLDESVVSHIPESINEEQAATIPLVGLTAWQALHDFSQIEKNMNVLVLGGSGGVGSFAIQFAKAAGASVWTTASKKIGTMFLNWGPLSFWITKVKVSTARLRVRLKMDLILSSILWVEKPLKQATSGSERAVSLLVLSNPLTRSLVKVWVSDRVSYS
ncbi:MAG: NADP-dependent oxidoreductase [Bdellovibrionales bacterium]|nr:NADP-dependent oxidoreductase [Bdellovibrionales bacterium]